MLKRIIQIFSIPFEPENEDSNRDSIVLSLINIAFVIVTLYYLIGVISRGFLAVQLIIVIGMFTVLLYSRVLVGKGKADLVSSYMAGIQWLLATVLVLFFENGLRAPAYIAIQMFLIVYVGLLHGRRDVIILTILSILVSVIVAVLEFQGIFLTQPKVPDVSFTLFAQIIFYPLAAYLVIRTLRNLNLTIALYKNESIKRQQSEKKLEIAYETTLEGWAQALELKDKETVGHSRRVTDLALLVAEGLNLDEEEKRYIRYGALLHDIGKMGIPDEILNKTDALSPRDREIINQHPVHAYNLLKNISYLQHAISIPYSHHENWNGSGYPQGLKGENIPLAARIFSIVDNWDALTSNRPYRKAWSQEKAKKYLLEQSGKKFDPELVQTFLSVINHKKEF